MFAKFKQGSKDLAMIYNSENSSLPEVIVACDLIIDELKENHRDIGMDLVDLV